LIYAALKHKTRFCIFGDENLIPEGYYMCPQTAEIHDLSGIGSVEEMIDYIKQRKYNVFMFDINGDFEKYLEWSAAAAKNKFYINFSYINNANIETLQKQRNEGEK